MARPKNAKDLKKRKVRGRTAKSKNPLVVVDTDKVVKSANELFIKNLSGEMQKLYKAYTVDETKPIADLKDLANSMKARYKIALQTEMSQHEMLIKLYKSEYKEIEESGKIDDKRVSKPRLKNKLTDLRKKIGKNYRISSTVTTLGTELRSLLVEIERIEGGKDTRNVNIFNILNGGEKSPKVEALEEVLFPDVMDADIMDEGDLELEDYEDAQEPE